MSSFRALITILLTLGAFAGSAQDVPNILWITAEDMSPALGCYGDTFATSPNIDKLAEQSVVYTNAFASAPVCSPSRSCIINGLYATSQGTQQMRSAFPLPSYMTGFPSFLRKAGYYTSNNVKTDYNNGNFKEIIKASWDESSNTAHWRKRPADKNFCSVFNLMTSHQSRTMVWPYEKFVKDVQSKLSKDEIHDPAKVPLPPYYPDTPIIRREVARSYDCVTAMDKEVGAILKQLEDDGLADDTIVFFYSDHGNGMPRHKRALLDSGMKVAMMVRFPEKYQHLAPAAPGSRTDRLVSFVDFAPTALSLAGVRIPDYMEGKPFLGHEAAPPRQYIYGHRDRVDEVLDLARSVRDKRFLYIRNFMPHLGYNQPTAWPDLGEIRHEFYRLTERELMTAPQWHFAGPTRAVEELYDCQEDPMNLKNLARDPAHQAQLRTMRNELFDNISKTKDLGFLAEAYAWEISEGTTPWDLARSESTDYNQGLLVAAASAVGTASEKRLLANLSSGDAGVRYWGAVGLSAARRISKDAVGPLNEALTDDTASVRIEAANALCRHGYADSGLPVLMKALEHKNLSVVQHAARQVEMLGKTALPALSAMKACDARMKVIRPPGTSPVVVQPDKDMAMFVGFSTNAFITRFDGSKGEKGDDGKPGEAAGVPLFDGKTLNGWKAMVDADVKVVDGEIHMLSKGKNLWLVHEKVVTDFELTAETLMPDTYNSGIGFRCKVNGKKPLGYQAEVDGKKSGAIYAIGKGWVIPTKKDGWDSFFKVAGDCYKEGEWNSFKIRCVGDHIQVWINGHKTTDIHDARFKEGQFAIQHHGKGDVHRFRNIVLKEL